MTLHLLPVRPLSVCQTENEPVSFNLEKCTDLHV